MRSNELQNMYVCLYVLHKFYRWHKALPSRRMPDTIDKEHRPKAVYSWWSWFPVRTEGCAAPPEWLWILSQVREDGVRGVGQLKSVALLSRHGPDSIERRPHVKGQLTVVELISCQNGLLSLPQAREDGVCGVGFSGVVAQLKGVNMIFPPLLI